MLKKDTIVAGTIILTLAGILSRFLGFLYRIFLSNLIGAEDLGLFQMIMPVLSFCIAISCGGIQTAVARFVAESKDSKKAVSVFAASIAMSGFLSVIASFLLYSLSDTISVLVLHNESCADLLKYASYTIPLAAFHACATGYYLGLKKPLIPAFLQITEQIVKVSTLFVIGTVLIGNNADITPVVAVYSLIASELGGVLFCVLALLSDYSGFKLAKIKDLHLVSNIKMLFSVSYILTINRVMISFLQSLEAVIIPIVLMRYGHSNSEALSIYGILAGMALPVITFPATLTNSIAMIIMPRVAEANVSGEKETLNHTAKVTLWFSMTIGIFCIGMFIFFGDFIGADVFGHKAAGTYIKTLAWLCPFMYMSISFGSILHGLGKTTVAFTHNVIAISIRLIFLLFLVPRFGIGAYLKGLLFSELTTTFLHGYYINKEIPLDFSPVKNIIKPTAWLALSLTMGKLFMYILNYYVDSTSIVSTFVTNISCALFICVIFLLLALDTLKELR